MLTKWTRQPWTSSFWTITPWPFRVHLNHLILESTTLLQLTCYANSRILWVAYIPNILYQVAECLEWNAMIAGSFFLCHSWFTTAKKKVNFIGDNEIKKFNAVISVWTERTDRHLLVRHMNFPAPFWSNSWSCGWENSIKCDKISLSKLNKIAVWGKIYGKRPQRGNKESVVSHLYPYLPLRLNIDTCIMCEMCTERKLFSMEPIACSAISQQYSTTHCISFSHIFAFFRICLLKVCPISWQRWANCGPDPS